MKKTTVVLVLLAVLAVFVSSCTTREDEPPIVPQGTPTPDGQGYYTVSGAGVTFKWKTNGSNPAFLDCKVSAASSGWVAVGFNNASSMDGANFIIGYVTGGTTAVISDEYGMGHSHFTDTGNSGTNDITSPAGTESGGTTELVFTIPYNSGDAHDKVLSKGGTTWVIFGRGPDGQDNTTAQHAAYGAAQVTLY